MAETDEVVREAEAQIRGKIMKNTLYEIFDAITMIFSPLVESFFDHAEALSARLEMRKNGGRVQKASDATALRGKRAFCRFAVPIEEDAVCL